MEKECKEVVISWKEKCGGENAKGVMTLPSIVHKGAFLSFEVHDFNPKDLSVEVSKNLQVIASNVILDLQHVYVPPRKRGRGIGEILTKSAIDYAIAQKFKIRPSCSYVRCTFLERFPEYKCLIEEAYVVDGVSSPSHLSTVQKTFAIGISKRSTSKKRKTCSV